MDGDATRVDIEGNRIDHTTAHGIDLRNVGGPARIERNIVVTGPVGRSGAPGSFVNALRLIGSGDHDVSRNEFDCGFPNGAVVRLGGTENARIRQNEIRASVSPGQQPEAESAGVQVRGTAIGNEILENRIRGRGRVALAAIHSDFGMDIPGNPVRNMFKGNNFQKFEATVAAVEVGEGAVDTHIVGGSGILIDNGTGTIADGNFEPPQ